MFADASKSNSNSSSLFYDLTIIYKQVPILTDQVTVLQAPSNNSMHKPRHCYNTQHSSSNNN